MSSKVRRMSKKIKELSWECDWCNIPRDRFPLYVENGVRYDRDGRRV